MFRRCSGEATEESGRHDAILTMTDDPNLNESSVCCKTKKDSGPDELVRQVGCGTEVGQSCGPRYV